MSCNKGYVHIWVAQDGPAARREAVADFLINGNPGYRWGQGAPRGNPGYRWGQGAPIISSDGQAILYANNLDFKEGQFYALQSASGIPAPPAWARVVGRAYRLTQTADAPKLDTASLSISYRSSDVSPDLEQGINIGHWNETRQRWELLATTRNTVRNEAVAGVQGPGLYVLLASREQVLEGPNWNAVRYEGAFTQTITAALEPITDTYTVVYHHAPAAATPWTVYGVGVPDWVNDLKTLQNGEDYWIYVTDTTTLRMAGAPGAAAALAAPSAPAGAPPEAPAVVVGEFPPATYYGVVQPHRGVTPAVEQVVDAYVGSRRCGQAKTQLEGGQVVYRIKVNAEGFTGNGCGAYGRMVRFQVKERVIAPEVVWDNRRIQAVPTRQVHVKEQVIATQVVPDDRRIQVVPTSQAAEVPISLPVRLYLPLVRR